MKSVKKVAILGAGGHIGKSLSERFAYDNNFETFLYSRRSDLERRIHSIDEFNSKTYDVVINCTGIGTPSVLKKDPSGIFRITEKVDDLILDNLVNNSKTLYINMSSGAVYKKIDPSNISTSDFYSIAKINSEAKHRAKSELSIVDLRLFAFFSKNIDLSAGFFMSDVARSLIEKTVLETSPADMIRDYTCPDDLFSIVKCVIEKNSMNDFFDVYSKSPVSKFELLDYLKNTRGLEYKIKGEFNDTNPTGKKDTYYSIDKKAEILGYQPRFSSLEGIENELKLMI